MPPPFLDAIDAQIERTPPQRMSLLARTLYFASLGEKLAVLQRRQRYTAEGAHKLMHTQSLATTSLDAMWLATAEIDGG